MVRSLFLSGRYCDQGRKTERSRRQISTRCRLMAEGVEELSLASSLVVPFFLVAELFRPALGAGWDRSDLPGLFFGIGQAGSSIGGEMAVCRTRRFRFWTVAVSRNSSRAPVRPRRRNRSSLRVRFASPNRVSILLRLNPDTR